MLQTLIFIKTPHRTLQNRRDEREGPNEAGTHPVVVLNQQ
jgi:hypothetical protein